MKYVEISIEEAMKRCKKNTKVLVAEQDLENDDCEVIFISKGNKDYGELFKDVQTAASLSDDLVKQLRLFTEHQDILNILPSYGKESILQAADGELRVDLGPSRIHIFEVNTPNIENETTKVYKQNIF